MAEPVALSVQAPVTCVNTATASRGSWPPSNTRAALRLLRPALRAVGLPESEQGPLLLPLTPPLPGLLAALAPLGELRLVLLYPARSAELSPSQRLADCISLSSSLCSSLRSDHPTRLLLSKRLPDVFSVLDNAASTLSAGSPLSSLYPSPPATSTSNAFTLDHSIFTEPDNPVSSLPASLSYPDAPDAPPPIPSATGSHAFHQETDPLASGPLPNGSNKANIGQDGLCIPHNTFRCSYSSSAVNMDVFSESEAQQQARFNCASALFADDETGDDAFTTFDDRADATNDATGSESSEPQQPPAFDDSTAFEPGLDPGTDHAGSVNIGPPSELSMQHYEMPATRPNEDDSVMISENSLGIEQGKQIASDINPFGSSDDADGACAEQTANPFGDDEESSEFEAASERPFQVISGEYEAGKVLNPFEEAEVSDVDGQNAALGDRTNPFEDQSDNEEPNPFGEMKAPELRTFQNRSGISNAQPAPKTPFDDASLEREVSEAGAIKPIDDGHNAYDQSEGMTSGTPFDDNGSSNTTEAFAPTTSFDDGQGAEAKEHPEDVSSSQDEDESFLAPDLRLDVHKPERQCGSDARAVPDLFES